MKQNSTKPRGNEMLWQAYDDSSFTQWFSKKQSSPCGLLLWLFPRFWKISGKRTNYQGIWWGNLKKVDYYSWCTFALEIVIYSQVFNGYTICLIHVWVHVPCVINLCPTGTHYPIEALHRTSCPCNVPWLPFIWVEGYRCPISMDQLCLTVWDHLRSRVSIPKSMGTSVLESFCIGVES